MAKQNATVVDLSKICRTCLNESLESKSIFDHDDSTITTTGQPMMIAEMLLGFANIQVENNDGMPNLICTQCLNQICQAFCFKQLCEQSDSNLRTYLGKPPVNGGSNDSKVKVEEVIISSADLIDESNQMYLDDFSTSRDLSSSSDSEMDEYADELLTKIDEQLNEDDVKIIAQKQLVKVTKANKKMNGKEKIRGGKKDANISRKKWIIMEKCQVCKKTFTNFKSFRKHLRTHIEDRPHACEQCNKTFTEWNYLNNHMRTHIPDEQKPFKCDVCEKRFFHESLLLKHLAKHKDQKPFICKICNKGCYAENSLLKHMRIHQKKEGDPALLKHICDYCRTEFVDAQTLSAHIKQHTGDRPFLCSLCGKSFPQRFNLDLHLRTHTGERPFTCEVCKNGYVSKASLKIHMRTHTNERPYVCDFCGRAFRQSGDLASHKRLHGTEKPIECEVCKKTFTTVMKLKYHMRNHTGERPYVCKICNRGFTVNTILLRHMRVHSGERPYVCVTCGKAFSQSSTLNTHMRVHSNANKEKKQILPDDEYTAEQSKYMPNLPPPSAQDVKSQPNLQNISTDHLPAAHITDNVPSHITGESSHSVDTRTGYLLPDHLDESKAGLPLPPHTRQVYVVTDGPMPSKMPILTDNRILVEQDARLLNVPQVVVDDGRILTDKYIPRYDSYRPQHIM